MYDEATLKAAALGPIGLAEHLWATRYCPALEAHIKHESAMRSDPFAQGVTYSVFGEELRLMTPRDLVELDGFDNPFVTGEKPDALATVDFLWTLHRDNRGGRVARSWRRGRTEARISVRLKEEGLEAAIAEIDRYMRRVLFDLPTPDPSKTEQEPPPPINSVAVLLTDVAGIFGPRDPFTGDLIADSPIPRLVQYRRSRQPPQKNTGAYERARVLCMDEVNQILRELREKPA